MTVDHGLGSDAPGESGDRTGQHAQDLVSEILLPLLAREQVEQALTQQEEACQLNQRLYDSDDKQLCIHARLRVKRWETDPGTCSAQLWTLCLPELTTFNRLQGGAATLIVSQPALRLASDGQIIMLHGTRR